MKDYFSKPYFACLLSSTEDDYHSTISDLRNNQIIVPKKIKKILLSQQLKKYSPVKYFFIKRLYDYFYISEINQVTCIEKFEDQIFEFWSEGEYSQQFFDSLDSKDIFETSKVLVKKLESNAQNFYNVHISEKHLNQISKDHKLIYEFGDQPSIINLPETNSRFSVLESKVVPLSTQNPFVFLPSNQIFDNENTTKYIDKINLAYTKIKEVSPDLYEALITFTKYIVPSSEEEIVSHSTDELPGFSTINLLHRDEIDLLDDLLHENGHHYLNHFLNHAHLLNEDDEKIFYSPWRESLRAIRGIFHAYLTFYWAFYLFRELVTKSDDYRNNSKCHARFLEEYYMLNYSYDDLLIAHTEEKVTDEGLLLLKYVNDELLAAKDLVKKSTKHLEKSAPLLLQEISELNKTLINKRKEFSST